MPIPSPCPIKDNVDLTCLSVQDALEGVVILLELLDRWFLYGLRRNVCIGSPDRGIEISKI
jgi:hypothetical protein